MPYSTKISVSRTEDTEANLLHFFFSSNLGEAVRKNAINYLELPPRFLLSRVLLSDFPQCNATRFVAANEQYKSMTYARMHWST